QASRRRSRWRRRRRGSARRGIPDEMRANCAEDKPMITPAQIDLWRASPSETAKLEFKEAKTSFSLEKLYEYCVAIANEGGGHLLFGVADKPPRAVVGTAAF